MKSIITAAGKNHRHLPLQTMVDTQGVPVSILCLQLRELQQAGVEKVGVIINPGDEGLMREAARELADFIECIPQPEPLGYGHAILCAESFVGDQPFLLSIADHLFVSDRSDRNCFQQVMDAAVQLGASVSAVQSTSEGLIHRFGTIGGERIDGEARLLHIREVIEKPTPTIAEQSLMVSGLRAGRYFSYFGVHVLQPSIFRHLRQLLDGHANPTAVSLTDAVNQMLGEEDYYALDVEGRRFDLEAPFGLLHGQVALALKSPAREQILSDLLHLVAER